jgi:hypothetical protein
MIARVTPGWWDISCAAFETCQSPLWVSMTPLARPVVPPVYISAARSAGSRLTAPVSAASSSWANGVVPGGASPTTITGTSSAAACTVPSSSGEVTTATAPLSTRMCRSSSTPTRNTTGVTTAPTAQSAW